MIACRWMTRLWSLRLFPGRICVLLVCMLLSGVPVFAQIPDRPRLALDFQGPAGKTRAVGFLSHDRIFAAGESKVLQTWDLQRNNAGIPLSAVPGSTIRWEFARGARGGINCAAVNASRQLAVIAGFSARSNHDIMLFSPLSGETVGALPNQRGPSLQASPGDQAAHWGSFLLRTAFSPDGTQLVTSSANGEVWHWNLARGPANAVGQQVETPRSVDQLFHPVAFLNNSTILYSRPVNPEQTLHQLWSWDVNSRRSTLRYRHNYERALTTISASPDGTRVVTADAQANIWLESGGRVEKLPISEIGGFPASTRDKVAARELLVSRTGQLLAVAGDLGEDQSYLLLYDLVGRRELDRMVFADGESCHALAFDEQDTQLLSHDDSRELLLLWPLAAADGRIPEKPLSGSPPLAIGGRGRQIDQAGFRADRSTADTGYEMIFRDPAAGIFSFDPEAGTVLPVADSAIPPINGRTTFAQGWSVEAEPASLLVQNLTIAGPDGRVLRLQLDAGQQGEFRGTYCFIPDADNNPAAVAIATGIRDGIYIYGLAELRQSGDAVRPLLRYFRDHNGEPTSLSVSSDHRFLLSAAKDKTLKIWSLEGLFQTTPARKSLYGGEFFADAQGTIRVRGLNKAGILFGRGLRENDRILRAEDDAESTPVGGFVRGPDMLRLAAFTNPFGQIYLNIERLGGQPENRVILVPGWEPLLTLVIDRTDEWVVFTPEGYFNASIAEGHRLFGWQFNRGRDSTPRFEPAAHLQKEFEKPDVIRGILRLGNVADALTAIGIQPPADFQVALGEAILRLPEIRIVAPGNAVLVAANAPSRLTANVVFDASANPAAFQVNANLGGKSLGPPVATIPIAGGTQYSWDFRPQDDLNVLHVTARETTGSLTNSRHTEQSVTVRSVRPPSPQRPRLFVFALGAEDYEHLQKLSFAVHDATEVFQTLKSHQLLSRDFASESILRTNAEIRRESTQKDARTLLDIVRQRKNPDDLILVYVTGHGDLGPAQNAEGQEFYFVPTHVNSVLKDVLRREGISWTDLSGTLNEAPCAVIWAIDACHAGAVSDVAKKVLFRDASGIQRRAVFLSASGKELARENVLAKVKPGDPGHGWFSMAFLETLIGNQFNQEAHEEATRLLVTDQSLKSDEVGAYVRRRVREQTFNQQNPVHTPKFIEPSTNTALPIEILVQKAADTSAASR